MVHLRVIRAMNTSNPFMKSIPSLLACATLAAATATAAPEKEKLSLLGSWTLQSWTIDGKQTKVPTVGITIRFEKKDKCSGRSGVNSYGGTYIQGSNNSLRFGSLFGTEMAGPPNLMQLESTYLSLLAKVSKFNLSKDGLTLLDGTSKTKLQFLRPVPVIATPLPGTHWTLSSITQTRGESVSNSALVEGTSITLEIAKDGGVSGSAGVNNYTGNVKIGKGGNVKFEGFGRTKKAGPRLQMRQESNFLRQLRTMTKADAKGERLVLTNADGTTALHFQQQKKKN